MFETRDEHRDSRRTGDPLLTARIDDHTRVLLSGHVRRKGLSDVENPVEVNVDRLAPRTLEVGERGLEREGRGFGADTGVVEEDVDLTWVS